jgi:hypothetical protein
MALAMTALDAGGHHPELIEAKRQLLSHKIPAGRVYRVYSPGDELAAVDAEGVPRTTILYVDSTGRPKTALAFSAAGLELWDGWPAGG